MPSAASSLMRFASAARSAAATASRFARLAERAALSTKAAAVERHTPSSDSHRAASVDPRLHRPPAAVPPPAMTAPASQTLSYELKEQMPEGKVKFVAEKKDLESDETLWALYERWCEAFNQERDHDEKLRWFSTFKKTVLHIHNNPNVGYRKGITKFADGKLRKPCCSDLLDLKIAEQVDHPCEFITDDSGKLYKRVFADYKVVPDRLYVHLPKGVDVKTITSNPEWAELEKYYSTNPEC